MSDWAKGVAAGDRLRDSWNSAFGGRGRLWHVRAVVDGQVMMRRWGPRTGGYNPWRYQLVPEFEGAGLIGYTRDRRARATALECAP